MGQSLVKNYLHITFSTRHRQPWIYAPYDSELYNYIGGICNKLDCQPIKTGGHVDHVHILCMLSKNITLVDLIEKIKSGSSNWIKTKSPQFKNFYWQNGYGAFSVNPKDVDKVADYIEFQHIHHAVKSYQDEFRAFLKKYSVEYSENMCGNKIRKTYNQMSSSF